MAVLRNLSVWTIGPQAATPTNSRFVQVASELAESYSHALRPLSLPARYTRVHVSIRWERMLDGAVHWRFIDNPTNQFEQGQIALPTEAEKWSDSTVQGVFADVCEAMLLRLGRLRSWDAGVVEKVVSGSGDRGEVPLIFDPEPEIFISGGGGPTNDPRTHPYLRRHQEHISLFHDDSEWWRWWVALGRPEADLSVGFYGRPGLRVTATGERITFGRNRPPESIPKDVGSAGELADEDLLEALARLVKKLALAPHPPLD